MSPARERRAQGATRLARMRIKRDLSQAELAAATGLSKPTIERLEHGKVANPGIVHLLALAAALGLRPRRPDRGRLETGRTAVIAPTAPPQLIPSVGKF